MPEYKYPCTSCGADVRSALDRGPDHVANCRPCRRKARVTTCPVCEGEFERKTQVESCSSRCGMVLRTLSQAGRWTDHAVLALIEIVAPEMLSG